jgi:hypothetical protein
MRAVGWLDDRRGGAPAGGGDPDRRDQSQGSSQLSVPDAGSRRTFHVKHNTELAVLFDR